MIAMISQPEPIVLKPRIARCGNHWSVEWNRSGDYYPMNICTRTWKEALDKAAVVVIKKLHATTL